MKLSTHRSVYAETCLGIRCLRIEHWDQREVSPAAELCTRECRSAAGASAGGMNAIRDEIRGILRGMVRSEFSATAARALDASIGAACNSSTSAYKPWHTHSTPDLGIYLS